MALLGYPRGHRIIPGDSVLQGSTRCLMSVWILSREPERRRTDGLPLRHENLGSPEFLVTLKLLAFSVVRRRNVPPSSKV
jgi:hypothetical protein